MRVTSELNPVLDLAPEPAPRTDRCGPRIDFVDLCTSWRYDVQFATAVDPDAHRDQVFAGLSLTLPAGGITVLLGARGSGKTLLTCHLIGAVAPDSGHVLVGGRSVWEMPEWQRRELRDGFGVYRGGIRIRESATDDSRSVLDNLIARLARGGRTEHLEEIGQDYLGQFGLAEFADTLPGALDAPARRRLALVLALVGDPAVVVLDDPGLALDRHHFERVIEGIERWHARTRSTVLITVRSLAVARALGRQVAVLRDGQVIAHGRPEQVLAGVVDDESFERRFGTDMGGFAEADPERGRRTQRLINKSESRRYRAHLLAFLLMGVTTVVVLLSGIITAPF